jgi:hypothetical protein
VEMSDRMKNGIWNNIEAESRRVIYGARVF